LEDGAKETAEYFSVFSIRKQYCKKYQVVLVPFRSANMKAVLRFCNKPCRRYVLIFLMEQEKAKNEKECLSGNMAKNT